MVAFADCVWLGKSTGGAWGKQFQVRILSLCLPLSLTRTHAQGDFECPIPRDQLEERAGQVWAKTLDEKHEGDALLLTTVKGWLQPKKFPKGQGIKSIEVCLCSCLLLRLTLCCCVHFMLLQVVFNPARFRLFLGQLEALEHRQLSPAFAPKLEQESHPEQRAAVLAHLDSLAAQVQHNRKLRIVRVWHGTNANVLQHILEDGFAAIATLDDGQCVRFCFLFCRCVRICSRGLCAGWFGKGIYLTSSAKYALRYCKNPKVLVLCYALLLNPYPLIADDAPEDKEPEQFALYGRGNHKNYQVRVCLCSFVFVFVDLCLCSVIMLAFRLLNQCRPWIFARLLVCSLACLFVSVCVFLSRPIDGRV